MSTKAARTLNFAGMVRPAGAKLLHTWRCPLLSPCSPRPRAFASLQHSSASPRQRSVLAAMGQQHAPQQRRAHSAIGASGAPSALPVTAAAAASAAGRVCENFVGTAVNITGIRNHTCLSSKKSLRNMRRCATAGQVLAARPRNDACKRRNGGGHGAGHADGSPCRAYVWRVWWAKVCHPGDEGIPISNRSSAGGPCKHLDTVVRVRQACLITTMLPGYS